MTNHAKENPVKRWPDPQRSKVLTEHATCPSALGDVEVEWGNDQKVVITCTLAQLDAIIDDLEGEADHEDCIDEDTHDDAVREAREEGREEGRIEVIEFFEELAETAA